MQSARRRRRQRRKPPLKRRLPRTNFDVLAPLLSRARACSPVHAAAKIKCPFVCFGSFSLFRIWDDMQRCVCTLKYHHESGKKEPGAPAPRECAIVAWRVPMRGTAARRHAPAHAVAGCSPSTEPRRHARHSDPFAINARASEERRQDSVRLMLFSMHLCARRSTRPKQHGHAEEREGEGLGFFCSCSVRNRSHAATAATSSSGRRRRD